MQHTWSFDADAEGWVLLDDAFYFTRQPDYAWGHHAPGHGHSGGGLYLRLGGRDNSDVEDMSGAWTTRFTLEAPEQVFVSFWYRMDLGSTFEPEEYSEVRVAVDGEAVGLGGADYITRMRGDGNGGDAMSTGWQRVTLDLGTREAGGHRLDLGGYLNQKTQASEVTRIFFDDVMISSDPAAAIGAFEARVVELTNAFRAEHGKAALRVDVDLSAAAEDWSRTMAEDDFFAHSTPDQVAAFGYEWTAWGENIAAGHATPEAVVQGWIDSPGHRANLLSDAFEEIGVGYVHLADDTGATNYHHYWTQTFGTEQSDALI